MISRIIYLMKYLIYPKAVILLIICACKTGKAPINNITEAEAIKIAEDTLHSVLSAEEFDDYKPFKALSRNEIFFEIVPHDIEEYGGWPPIVCIDKATGKILEIRWGN